MKSKNERVEQAVSGAERGRRRLPCVALAAGILVYGAALAAYMLANSDILSHVSAFNLDDSFYYFQVARNMAEGHFSTFDGGITRTNGYHPLWMLVLIPFFLIFDPETALHAIKAFEIALVAGALALVVVAGYMARLPWAPMIAIPAVLFAQRSLLRGMESALALFVLAALFAALVLWGRSSGARRQPLGVILFLLPWVRLEFAAISLSAALALYAVERYRPRERCELRSTNASLALALWALAGTGVYFAWNGIMFGGIVPVSGEVKRAWSEVLWGAAGGYDILENFLTVSSERTLDTLAAFGVCAGALVFRFTALRTGRLSDYNLAYIAFLAGVFGLAAGTVAKFAQTVLTMHPRWGIFSIYYVPGDLMMPLLLVVAWPLAARWIERFPNRRKLRFAAAPIAAALAVGAAIALYRPFDRINEASEAPPHLWRTSSLAGTAIMNRILPDNSVIGSYDAGVVAYFSRFPVVNLDGLMNSYAYLREGGPLVRFLTMEYPQSRFGLTHLANVSPETSAASNGAVFVGAPYPENDFKVDFKVIPVDGLSVAPEPEDAAASFWETMSPYFDYRLGNVGITTEGRLIHAIFRDCRPEEIRDTAFALSWTSPGGGARTRLWRPGSAATRNQLGFCAAIALLPRNDGSGVRIEEFAEP